MVISTDVPRKLPHWALKQKIELYYACWNKNGWPELEGFEPSSSVAQTYYAAAASDFSKVINNYGRQSLVMVIPH